MNGVNNKPDAIYANFVAISNSAYEMRIEFLVESPEQDKIGRASCRERV